MTQPGPPSPPNRAADLALYHFPGCPYCERVTRALGRLGVRLELRDIRADPARRDELVAARGRKTVPVLRIRGAGQQEERWMPESLEIVAYLERRFGEGP